VVYEPFVCGVFVADDDDGGGVDDERTVSSMESWLEWECPLVRWRRWWGSWWEDHVSEEPGGLWALGLDDPPVP
jgi:hypothetical protein